MKKVLLATTALGVFAAGAAFAEGPTLAVGGKIVTQVGIADQDHHFTDQSVNAVATNARLRDTKNQHIRTDSRVDLKVSGKADNGLSYGGVTSIIGNASAQDDDGNNSTAGEKTYIFVESGLGKVEAGSNSGASQTMKVGAANIARGSGGIAGDFYKFVNLGAVSNSSNALKRQKFIVTPDLPSVALPGARNKTYSNSGGTSGVDVNTTDVTEYANKITYYSPRIMGVQAGVSYAPSLAEQGNANGFAGKFVSTPSITAINGPDSGTITPAQYLQDVWTGGLNYQGEYNQVGIKASAVAEGSSEPQKLSSAATSANNNFDSMRAYELGLNLSYAGATIGGSWATIPEMGRLKAANDEAGFWTLGAGYEFGPFAASVTYLDSRSEEEVGTGFLNSSDNTHKNRFQNLSVGADYKLAPGLVPYVEVNFFDTKDAAANNTKDNDGSVVLVGTQLTF